MERQNNNSDKTTFKVKFFGEYHDIVIDWDDDQYGYKQQDQIYEQLESITGIPIKYDRDIYLFEVLPGTDELTRHHIINHTIFHGEYLDILTRGNPNIFEKGRINNAITRAGGRFIIVAYACLGNLTTKYLTMRYNLVPESVFPEGVCSRCSCQYRNSRTFFDKVKDAIHNEELKLRTLQIDETNEDWWEAAIEIYREFNVLQYIFSPCPAYMPPFHVISQYRACYLRTRG